MRAWQISRFGIESLEFVERPTPTPGPGEVLIGVRAISFNFRDLLMVKGQYNPHMILPRIPCSDGAGEVVAVGEGVTAWKPGDRVLGSSCRTGSMDGSLPARAKGALGGDIDGMLADYVVLSEDRPGGDSRSSRAIRRRPPCPAPRLPLGMRLRAGNLKPGDTVLILGTGGVSIFALQFARMMGMRVLGISSSYEKLQRAIGLGWRRG